MINANEIVAARMDCGEVEVDHWNGEGDKVLCHGEEPVFSDHMTNAEHWWLEDVAPGKYKLVCLLVEVDR